MSKNSKGRVFVCADLHFSHSNIIKYEDRPFKDKDDMNEGLIRNWNSVVTGEDTVFVLGDVAFCNKSKAKELVSRLNGRKILIMGNHDRVKSPKYWEEVGFDFVSPYPILYRGCILRHEPPVDDEGDLFVPESPYYQIYGHVHGSEDFPDHIDDSACVSIERLDYRPALLEDVISGAAYKKVKSDA